MLGASGDLRAVGRDGTGIWHVPILERFKGENLKWGLSESPLVEGDTVIVATGSKQGSIVAFDKQTGAVVWQSKGLTDEPGYASAIAATVGGVRQIIHFTASAAVGVRAGDGSVLWRYERAANDTANCATPIFHDDHVFVTSAYDTGGALLRLTSKKGKTKAEEVYFTRDMMNHHGGVVLVGDHLYGFSNAILTCMNFQTGEVKWQDRSVGKGSLTAAEGKLYVLGERGRVALVHATPDSYQEYARFSFEPTQLPVWAHPVVADGRLYIRNGSQIDCYDIAAIKM